MWIDIVEISFGIVNGQISSIFDRVICCNTCVFFVFFFVFFFHSWTITLVNINGFSTHLVCALILLRSAFDLLMVEFRPFLTELSTAIHRYFMFRTIA